MSENRKGIWTDNSTIRDGFRLPSHQHQHTYECLCVCRNLCVFITGQLLLFVLIASFVLNIILYCIRCAGHDAELCMNPPHTHTLCVIKFVDCVPTWIQIICSNTMGCRMASIFFIIIVVVVMWPFAFWAVLFVLEKIYLDFWWMLLLHYYSWVIKTRIQRDYFTQWKESVHFLSVWMCGCVCVSHLRKVQTINEMMTMMMDFDSPISE